MNTDEFRDALTEQERYAPDERSVLNELAHRASASGRAQRQPPGWVAGVSVAATVAGIAALTVGLAGTPAPSQPPAATINAIHTGTTTANWTTGPDDPQVAARLSELSKSAQDAVQQAQDEKAAAQAAAAKRAAASAASASAAAALSSVSASRATASTTGATDPQALTRLSQSAQQAVQQARDQKSSAQASAAAAAAGAQAAATSVAGCNAVIQANPAPASGPLDTTVQALVQGCGQAWGLQPGYSAEWVQTTAGQLADLLGETGQQSSEPVVAIQVQGTFARGGQNNEQTSMLIHLYPDRDTPTAVDMPIDGIDLGTLGVVHHL